MGENLKKPSLAERLKQLAQAAIAWALAKGEDIVPWLMRVRVSGWKRHWPSKVGSSGEVVETRRRLLAMGTLGLRENPVVIRPFEERDWPRVRAILDAVVSHADSFTYDPNLSDAAARALWIESPPGRTVVAVDANDIVVGTAKMGRNQRGPGSHVATASFMVDPEARRQGIGRRLGEFALTWATGAGFRGMQFNAVVASNAAAVGLWRSLGFEVVGTIPEGFRHPDGRFVDLLIMFRRLAGANP